MTYSIHLWNPSHEANQYGWVEAHQAARLCDALRAVELLESLNWDREATIEVRVSGEQRVKKTRPKPTPRKTEQRLPLFERGEE